MKVLIWTLAFALTGLTISSPVRADSGQIVAKSNINDLCKSEPATSRKTIVYVDLTSVRKDDATWGLTILNKLELGPREWLTILGVDPGTFEVTDFFDLCYPTLTSAEMELERSGRGIWEKLTKLDPEAQQRENVQTFDTNLKASLNRIAAAANKTIPGKSEMYWAQCRLIEIGFQILTLFTG
jgi:hypothetical protein